MSQNLVIVSRNPQPKRELNHPDIWLIYTPGELPVEVHLPQLCSAAIDWIPLETVNRSLT
jgi:hypothetical protein